METFKEHFWETWFSYFFLQKMKFWPRAENAVIAALTLLESAVFYELEDVLFVCYNIMQGWYEYLLRGNTPLILSPVLIDLFFVTFLSLICKRALIDPSWDTIREMETFSIERWYNSIRHSSKSWSQSITSFLKKISFLWLNLVSTQTTFLVGDRLNFQSMYGLYGFLSDNESIFSIFWPK